VTIAVLANDSAPAGDTPILSAVGAAESGSLTVNPDGTITYTPDPGATGADSFSYTITDAAGDTATTTVSVSVSPDELTAVDDRANTKAGTPVTVTVLGNDSDSNGDPLSVSSVSTPAYGSVFLNSDGTVVYTPVAGFSGLDTFTYGRGHR
jgi:hypothetical protein